MSSETPRDTFHRVLTIRISAAQNAWLEQYAATHERSLAFVIRKLIDAEKTRLSANEHESMQQIEVKRSPLD